MIAINDTHVEELSKRASAALRAGKVEEGIAAHRELLALRPQLPDAWYNLARLERFARRYEDALASYAEALERGAGRPEEIHLNRAVILSEHLNRVDEAETELTAAIAANPDYVDARLNLGNLHEDRGAVEAARDAYEAVLAIDPGNGRAQARLATIDIFEGQSGHAIERLRAALLMPGLGAHDRAQIAFALGNALDASGRYDEAFAAYREGNALRRDAVPYRYDPAAIERLIDSIIAAFPEPASATPAPGEPPIFLCGMFRSGSTLSEQILGRHSRVTAGGELEFLPALVARHLQPFPAAFVDAAPDELAALRDAYQSGVRQLHPDADIVTDKRPDNFLYIGLIKALFPQAKIVHTCRNPMDNILSVYFLDFEDRITYSFDLADATHWYLQYRRLMAHWKSLYGDDIHDFDYDRTVADPEPEVRGLLEFCGLAWEDQLLKAPEATVVRTASAWQVRQPLHQRSSGRWRNYESHLGEVREALPAD